MRSWIYSIMICAALGLGGMMSVHAQENATSDQAPSQVTPDFEERVDTLMNMVKARLDQASRGDDLSVPQRQARILQEAIVLLGQLEFYIATFGIHDTFTTVQEINKFRPIVAAHVGKHLSGE